jgi:hypothetical protein
MDGMRAILPDVTVVRAILLCAVVTAAILVKRRERTSHFRNAMILRRSNNPRRGCELSNF